MIDIIESILMNWGVDEAVADEVARGALLTLIILCGFFLYWMLRNYLLKLIHRITIKTSNTWDDALVETKVFQRFLRLIPLTFIALCVDRILPNEFETFKRIVFSLIIFVGARSVDSLLNAISEIYQQRNLETRKPIRPFIQTLIIVDYMVAMIFIVSVLLNKSPWYLMGLLGGITAVTMLVFKDTILGFVAGIQLSANDMVHEGDWIEMPKYGADGDVVEVTINTVKVQNWDKTITTIPTYALISDSFKNWRGMSAAPGRRIKRNVCIDMNTVCFVDEAMLDHFRKMTLLTSYVDQRQTEIDQANKKSKIDLSATIVNGRHQTNLGIFRAYLLSYLRSLPVINQDMTFLVRHLQSTPQGLPIEIYVFSSDKVWANYESIQSDIFDHVIAALPEFGLRVYQQPSGHDLADLTTAMKQEI